MSIQSEIDRLVAAKTAIADALTKMGIAPPAGTTLDEYAAQLTAIAASAPWLPLTGGTLTGALTVNAAASATSFKIPQGEASHCGEVVSIKNGPTMAGAVGIVYA